MILDNDKTVIKSTEDRLPIDNSFLFELGFIYVGFNTIDNRWNRWVKKDSDGTDIDLTPCSIDGNYMGVIRYARCMDDRCIDGTSVGQYNSVRKTSCTVYMNTRGQLIRFLSAIEKAAALDRYIRSESAEIEDLIAE